MPHEVGNIKPLRPTCTLDMIMYRRRKFGEIGGGGEQRVQSGTAF